MNVSSPEIRTAQECQRTPIRRKRRRANEATLRDRDSSCSSAIGSGQQHNSGAAARGRIPFSHGKLVIRPAPVELPAKRRGIE
jgi:hypothetical protein